MCAPTAGSTSYGEAHGGHRGQELGGPTADRGAREASREGPLRPGPEDGAEAHAGRVLEGRADHGPRDRRQWRPRFRNLLDHAVWARPLPRDLRIPGAVMEW